MNPCDCQSTPGNFACVQFEQGDGKGIPDFYVSAPDAQTRQTWGDENPPELRIIIQPGFVPFRSAGFRFAGFAWTSDFQAFRHSGRSVRGCRRNGFSISPAAFSRFAVFCRQVRRRRISTVCRACAEFSPDTGNARFGRNDGTRKCRIEKNGTSVATNRIRFRYGIPAHPIIEPRRSDYGLVLTSAPPHSVIQSGDCFRPGVQAVVEASG